MPHLHTSPRECDFTVTGYVVHKDRVLMQMHRKLGIWLAPGGHIEWNQTPIETLYAELEQEAGIRREALELIDTNPLQQGITRDQSVLVPTPFDIDVHDVPTTEAIKHRHIDMAYALISTTDEVHPDPGESQIWEWMDAQRLDEIVESTMTFSCRRAQLAIRLARGEV